MLHDYRTKEGSRLDVGWDGWLLSASMNSEGGAFGLHNQCYIHNGDILIDPLLSSFRSMQLGGAVCLLQHVGHVYNRFTANEHGLRHEDIDQRNRHSWGLAQKCAWKRLEYICLKHIQEIDDVHRKWTLCTKYYF